MIGTVAHDNNTKQINDCYDCYVRHVHMCLDGLRNFQTKTVRKMVATYGNFKSFSPFSQVHKANRTAHPDDTNDVIKNFRGGALP